MKKCDSYKFCAKSSFDWFFAHRLGILKYWPFPTYYPMGSRMSTISQKDTMVINFVLSRT
ncbi:hypothetical protein BHE74_00057047 [Ensete ventricosum]|nr:hypothetical protein BHE74_00057047 [Ensete ventricosum]RZR87119.1 hypothetical protein BHM03_00014440 [Ensete ventricosum]